MNYSTLNRNSKTMMSMNPNNSRYSIMSNQDDISAMMSPKNKYADLFGFAKVIGKKPYGDVTQ